MGVPESSSSKDLGLLQGSDEGKERSDYELSPLPQSRAPSDSSRLGLSDTEYDVDPLLKDTGAGAYRGVVSKTEPPSSASVNRDKKRRLQGWRVGVAASAGLAFLVLLTNFLFVVIASAKYVVDEGIGTLYEGDCQYVEQTAVWVHLAINILSSLVLGASNYTMQALCAPTRAEVNAAHTMGDWVDIGMPSFRNIRGRISRRKTVMWGILALSSIPIHLFYNSAVFKTIDANIYRPIVAAPGFLDGQPFAYNASEASVIAFNYYASLSRETLEAMHAWFVENRDTDRVQRLPNKECISIYGSNFVTGYSDVLLITEDDSEAFNHTVFSASELYITPDNVATDWICLGAPQTESDGCDVKKVEREADNWTVVSKRIDHCLARVTPAHCKLQFSQAILIVVIVMNFAKAVVMGYTFWAHKSSTLVTIGDAVSSFMCSRDPLTDFRCLMARKDVDHGPLQWCCGDDDEKSRSVQRKCSAWVSQLYTSTVSYLRSGRRELHGHRPRVQPLPQTWQGNREVWFRAASRKRWVATTLLLSTALIATAVLLVAGTRNDALDSPAQAFRMGFGKIDPRLLVDSGLPIHGASGLLAAVLLANVPQIICSFLYLAYNGLFTCMLLAEEWSRYYLHPKPLRVTGPRGQQRSKYYLQLPFTYSIPLITASALLHWLISESIFLARIDYYSDGGERQADSYSLTGYSPVPILLVVIVGTVMTVVLLGHGFRKFSSPMPVVGSCSVAIASACHPPKGDADAAYLPVAWGDVNSDGDGEVGHCAFTSVQVYEPVKDRMYAGEDTAKWKRE